MAKKIGLLTRTFEEVVNEYYNMLYEAGIHTTVLEKAVEIVQCVRNEVGHRGIMFLAAVYIASIELGIPVTQRKLSIIAKVTETSIRKWYNVIKSRMEK